MSHFITHCSALDEADVTVQCLIPDLSSDSEGFVKVILGMDWIDNTEFQHFCIRFLTELKSLRSDLLLAKQGPLGQLS